MGRNRKRTKQPPRVIQQIIARSTSAERMTEDERSGHGQRLSILVAPPRAYSAAELAAGIRMRGKVAYFCDTSQYIAKTDQAVWDAILGTGKLVIPPPVHQELQTWLKDPRENIPVHRLVEKSLSEPKDHSVLWYSPRSPDQIAALEYYVNLLGLRKKIHTAADHILSEQLGRNPTSDEISNHIQQAATSRGQLVGRQGHCAKVRSHVFNDEFLVVLAILFALTSGVEVTIVTSDEAVLDQFYEAIWLIDTHYRAMLLAEIVATDPASIPSEMVANPFREAFVDDQIQLVKKPSSMLREVLPYYWTAVPVNCLLVQSSTTQISWVAEREIMKLIDIKAQTHGLSTDRFEGRNCHVTLGDRAIARIGDWAAIGRDQGIQIPNRSLSLSVIDANLALLAEERASLL